MFISKISIMLFICILLSFFLKANVLAKKPNSLSGENISNNSNLLILKYDFDNFRNLSLQNLNNKDANDENVSYKSPWLAFFLSFFLPTTGQLYNGDYTKAAIQAAVILVGGGLMIGTGCVECGEAEALQTTLFFTGIGMAFSGYLWSIIDAPVSANNYNEKAARGSGLSLINSETGKYSIKLNRNSSNNVYSISLNVNF